MLFIADVVEPTDAAAVPCHDPVASGGREQATELRPHPQALLCILIADPLVHAGRSVIRFPLSRTPARRHPAHRGSVSWFRQMTTSTGLAETAAFAPPVLNPPD